MKRMATHLLMSVTLLLSFIFAQKTSAQSTVVLPGSFQSELGCTGDWMPDCNATRLTQTGPDTWEGTFLIPAGYWEFKVAYDNSWNENYGLGGVAGGANIPLSLAAATLMHFSFSSTSHLVTFNPVNPPGVPSYVVLAGSFQSEMGCPGDWMPDCDATGLTYDIDSQIWYGIFAIPPGNYEYKVTIDHSWTENYGLGGVPNGSNIPLTVTGDKKILFRYNHTTHLVTTSVIDYNVILAGDFQSELGCAGDWMPDCPLSGLTFDPANNLWKKSMELSAGNWEFKVTVDGSWAINYGEGGVPNGPNISLNLAAPSLVSFVYNPDTHIITYTVTQVTVVLPGSFQSELGCAGDWMPDCNGTALTYDAMNNYWTGTFDIPAGYWEYKVALNNSWDENYGMYGIRNGPNIPLNLSLPASITFNYDPVTHLVTLVFNTTGLCAISFYDANGNGYRDYDENISMSGVAITLSNDTTLVQYTGTDGRTCFTGLTPGVYTAKETVPAGYLSSSGDSQTVNLSAPDSIFFGNVCLGSAGAENLAFWMNKKGKAAFDSLPKWEQDAILGTLQFFSLRNADGSDFDPLSYAELSTWMQKANAKNMAYKLSAQLAALFLNVEIRMLADRAVYTPGINFLGLQHNFMNAFMLALYVNQQLLFNSNSRGGDSTRMWLNKLTQMLEMVNNDQGWVQLQPCGITAFTTERNPLVKEPEIVLSAEPVIWPNPSGSHFNLRPAMINGNGYVQLKVVDAEGKVVYTAKGIAGKEYQFGEGFRPGLYFVELVQGSKKVVMKVVKQ